MNTATEVLRWVVAQLVVIAMGLAVFIYAILPSHPGKLAGGFFLTVWVLHVLFHKGTGRKFFAKTQSSRHLVARFWARGGERGVQLLFLGIGIILAVAGCVLIVIGQA